MQEALEIPVGRYQTSRYSLVEAEPLTGRMHQIRKHFAHIRHYIVGDKRHGDWRHNQMFKEELNCENMLLHAHTLTFQHPYSKQKICLQAAFPAYFLEIFDKFNWPVPLT